MAAPSGPPRVGSAGGGAEGACSGGRGGAWPPSPVRQRFACLHSVIQAPTFLWDPSMSHRENSLN